MLSLWNLKCKSGRGHGFTILRLDDLGANLLAKRPIPSDEGLIRLGALETGESIEASSRENVFLTHSALADM